MWTVVWTLVRGSPRLAAPRAAASSRRWYLRAPENPPEFRLTTATLIWINLPNRWSIIAPPLAVISGVVYTPRSCQRARKNWARKFCDWSVEARPTRSNDRIGKIARVDRLCTFPRGWQRFCGGKKARGSCLTGDGFARLGLLRLTDASLGAKMPTAAPPARTPRQILAGFCFRCDVVFFVYFFWLLFFLLFLLIPMRVFFISFLMGRKKGYENEVRIVFCEMRLTDRVKFVGRRK